MENKINTQDHSEQIAMLKTQLENAQKANREYKNAILKVLIVGGVPFFFFAYCVRINEAFGGLAVITFVITVFVLQKVTNSNLNSKAGEQIPKIKKFLFELEERENILSSNEDTEVKIASAISTLKNGKKKDKLKAIEFLRRCYKVNDTIINALIESTRDLNKLIQLSAVKAIGSLTPPTDKIINCLVEILRTKGITSIRIEAARSLAKIGEPAAAITIPILLEKCENYYANKDLYLKNSRDLILLFGNAAIKPAIDFSEKENNFHYAFGILYNLPEIPHEYLPLLIEKFEQQPNILTILQIIGNMSRPCPEAVTFLKEIITGTKYGKYSSQREYASKSLAKLTLI
ncbi:MAG: HEAT repeat domain-containing protein [Bacteroidia bacterium]|nr:HEAT repeat domain-containing protein [Bacteroidia bacterium]